MKGSNAMPVFSFVGILGFALFSKSVGQTRVQLVQTERKTNVRDAEPT
jgi:hypothetical protein